MMKRKINVGLIKRSVSISILLCLLILVKIDIVRSQYEYQPHLRMTVRYQTKYIVEKPENVTVDLLNDGGKVARNILIGFDYPANVFSIEAVQKIGSDELVPGQEVRVVFQVVALETGNFTVYVITTYFDEEGREYQISMSPGMNIIVNPQREPIDYVWIIILGIIVFCSFLIYIIYRAKKKSGFRRCSHTHTRTHKSNILI